MGYLTFCFVAAADVVDVGAAFVRGFDSPVNAFDLCLERTVIFEDLCSVIEFVVGSVKLNSKLFFFVVSFGARVFVGPLISVRLVVAVEPLVGDAAAHLAVETIGFGTKGGRLLLLRVMGHKKLLTINSLRSFSNSLAAGFGNC